MAQVSSSPHSIFSLLGFFLHFHGFENHFWSLHPPWVGVWEATCAQCAQHHYGRPSVHSTTCALSLTLQKSFTFWKNKIIFMPSKWENVPDSTWWSPWDCNINMLMNVTKLGFKGTCFHIHAWDSEDVAKLRGLGKGYKTGSKSLYLASYSTKTQHIPSQEKQRGE